jgi:putative ABC transport system permease protein
LEWLVRDLRVGLRLLGKDKAFSLAAALTLAVCIGANTALFSVVHNVLLRPLPVPESDRILLMANAYPRAGVVDTSNSGVPDYYDRLRETTVFEEQALFNQASVTVDQDGRPARLATLNVTPSFFRVLRIPAAFGRTFTDDEGEKGNDKKIVLSDALWHSQFGADTGVVGRDLRLDGQPYTIVGVMPKAMEVLHPSVLLWRPLAFTPEERSDARRHSNNYGNIGRLKPGATVQQAQAQIDALNAANLERFPQYKELLINAGFHTIVAGWHDRLVKDVKPTLSLMWGGALFVLLIGCVNVANLVLVRARTRQKELATRLALGAGRWQVARQLVIEGVLLALVAAAAGLFLGLAALRAVGTMNLQDLPHGSEIGLSAAVVAYALSLSLAIGAAMGLIPIASVLPANLNLVLREEGRGSTGSQGARRLRRGLVVTQVAFTFVLLVGAGLLFASFEKVLQVDPGFSAERLLTASITLPATRYKDENALRSFTDEALRRVRALPGVVAAGATDTIPFGWNNSDSVIIVEGYQMRPGESVISPYAVEVSPGYFEAMGVRLAKGRFFEDKDAAKALPVIIVDRKLAQRFWPDQDPVGRRMYFPTDINNLVAVNEKTVFLTVVGVIEDIKLHDLTEGEKAVGAYYVPVAQNGSRFLTFAVKTEEKPESVAGGLRAAIADLDRELPVFDMQTMEERADKALVQRRSPAVLSFSFGVVALFLSAIGIYGVLAYLVVQRRKEIGIRIALGSSGRGIFELVIKEGLLLIAGGFLLGAVGAFLLRRSLESQLFGIQAGDPRVLGAVTAVLAGVAFAACALPARRAARIDPIVALSE